MKQPKDVQDLAARLSQASQTPLAQPTPAVREVPPVSPEPSSPARSSKAKQTTASVFLRMPLDLFEKCDAEAIRRTKETGRGVTVQQVILDKLAGVL